VLDHAAFVIVRRLHIANATDAGIILRRGSHDNTVILNVIERARLGIWLGDGVGEGNRIVNNTISLSATHGIALDSVKGEPGRETVLDLNGIKDSGIHGMEINANYTTISNNSVSGSGRLSTGASGIHIYARNATEGLGRFNNITTNWSEENHDSSAQDGNGIQLDQWCDDNVVTNNTVRRNDGAGISVFDAARELIIGNLSYGNMLDPGHSHRHKGELTFASDDEHNVDHTRNVTVMSNVVDATNADVAAILVDVPTSRHPPDFSDNRLSNSAGGPIARWAGRDITSVAAWNKLVSTTAPDTKTR
jgi:parallel beta-helix repeat protein